MADRSAKSLYGSPLQEQHADVHDCFSSRPFPSKPIDRWLALASIAVGIVFTLLPRSPAVVIVAMLSVFGLLVHPLWNFWWIDRLRMRQWAACGILLFACVLLAYLSWPSPSQIGNASSPSTDGRPGEILAELQRHSLEHPAPSEIAVFANKIVVAVMDSKNRYRDTGFWVDRPRLIATCASTIPEVHGERQRAINIAIPFPVFMTSLAESVGTREGPANVVAERDGVALLSVSQNPFTTLKMFVETEDPKTGRVDRLIEEFVTPVMSTSRPREGDDVYLMGVERGSGEVPTFSFQQGRVSSVSFSGSIRVNTTLPFRSGYCGAPVLNSAREVIGLILGSSGGGDTAVATARDIITVMKSGVAPAQSRTR